ncbi:MAG: S1/P1 nuclease [Candidatus Binatia bacterium]
MLRLATVLLLLLVCVPTPVHPWGCEGHETIALLAETHLTSHARKMVHDLLEGSPADPRMQRFCHPTARSVMAEASTWADDVRADDASPFHGTGQWHFINIPRGASPGDLRRFCPARTGCVLTAINHQLAAVRSGRSDRRRVDALRFIIHLIGDLHQPLHCATNNDLGGNCVPVTYLGIEPQLSPDHPEDDVYQPNLHTVWDTSIIRRIMEHRSPMWFADFLEHRFQSQLMLWQRKTIDFNQWAWESHQLAEQRAYGLLPAPIRAERPERVAQCNAMSERILALHERLTERYQNTAAPVVEEQLAKAAIRLAMVLNQIWP